MPVPRSSFQWQCPRTANFRIPPSSPTPRIHTRDPSESLRFSPTLLSSFPLFLIFSLLDCSLVIEYPTLNRRAHDIIDISMRRALTTGLALYIGLGRVLSSPVQVQVPFELNKDHTPEVEDVLGPGSELKLFFLSRLSFIVVDLLVNVRPGSREPTLIRIVVPQNHRDNSKDDFCTLQTSIRTPSIEPEEHCPLHAIGTSRRRKNREPGILVLHTSSS